MTLYLNNFRIALPVAFPATRRPTRLPTLPFFKGVPSGCALSVPGY